jgi:hypothetical protein
MSCYEQKIVTSLRSYILYRCLVLHHSQRHDVISNVQIQFTLVVRQVTLGLIIDSEGEGIFDGQ